VTVFYQEMRWVSDWLPTEDAHRINRKIRTYLEFIEGVLQAGMDQGRFRPMDAGVAAYGLLGMATWTYQWYQPGGPLTAEALTQAYADIFLHGMVNGG
jgi:hypothetical protein